MNTRWDRFYESLIRSVKGVLRKSTLIRKDIVDLILSEILWTPI